MFGLRNIYQNYRIKRRFLREGGGRHIKPRSGNALIISTGSSYLKFSIQDIQKLIDENNITTVIGINNLLLYDPKVETILTDYMVSYSGYFEKKLTSEVISFYSDDGDFGHLGAAESLKACKNMLKILLTKSALSVWIPINNFQEFSHYNHIRPFSNLSSMSANNKSDISKVIFGNGMVAIFAAALARNYGSVKIFSIGLDNDAFRFLKWDIEARKYTYNYGHFYDEDEISVKRYFSGNLADYFANISKIHKLFHAYEIINLDDTGISGFRE